MRHPFTSTLAAGGSSVTTRVRARSSGFTGCGPPIRPELPLHDPG